jgi:REP element-mobilizing transposase RayT
MKQINFGFIKSYKNSFGGSQMLGKRKTKRPLSTKKPIHLILKSTQTGVFSPGNKSLEQLITLQAAKFNVQIYEYALNWSHIHLVIRLKQQNDYTKFIRALTSILAQRIYANQRRLRKNILTLKGTGRNALRISKVFTLRPFTRILEWGRDFKVTLSYQIFNQREARGLLGRCKKGNKRERLLDLKSNAI